MNLRTERRKAIAEKRLPDGGFRSLEHAREVLYCEVLRLRASGQLLVGGSGSEPTRAELERVTREDFYDANIVVRDVADYVKAMTLAGHS